MVGSELGARSILLRLGAAILVVGAAAPAPPGAPAGAGVFEARRADRIEPVTDVAALLPDDLLVCAEARGLADLARHGFESPLWRRVAASPAWSRFLKSPEYSRMLAALGAVQLVGGVRPAELAAALLGEQAMLGIVPANGTPGFLLLVRTADVDAAARLVRVARALAVASKDPPHDVRDFGHGGFDGVNVDQKLWLANADRCVVAASSEALAVAALDRVAAPAADRRSPGLVETMRSRADAASCIRAAIDVPRTSAARPDRRLAPARADDIFCALFLGDLLEAACRSDVLVADAVASQDDLVVRLRVPAGAAALDGSFRSFGHARAAKSLPTFQPKNTLLRLSLRRDLLAFWSDRDRLCAPCTEKTFNETRMLLALIEHGLSPEDEILPQLTDEIELVLSRQTFPGITAPPVVRYPAGALILRTREDATKLSHDLVMGLRSCVALINFERVQRFQSPLREFVDEFRGVSICGGRPIPDDDRRADAARFNFSPAVTWIGDRIVISTSEELLRDLVVDLQAAAATPKSEAAAAVRGVGPAGRLTDLSIDGAEVVRFLTDNREPLIANAVLEQGKERGEAERQADLLLGAASLVQRASLDVCSMDPGLQVSFRLELVPLPPAAHAEGTR
jgi:hypothetical protein